MKTVSIKNGRLEVDIRVPDGSNEPDFCRFDEGCRIERVVFDGHSFCRPEQILKTRRTSEGYGLVYEWVMADGSFGAKSGEYFPKLGIGKLRQDADGADYDIFKRYGAERSKLTFKEDGNALKVTEDLPECRGIGARIVRTVTVQGDRLTVATEVTSTGTGAVRAREYGHNFVALDDAPTGPEYVLTMHCLKDVSSLSIKSIALTPEGRDDHYTESPFALSESAIGFTRKLDNEAIFVSGGQEDIKDQGSETDMKCMWTLSGKSCPVSISEWTSFSPARYAIWGNEQCICPEIFTEIKLMPGETESFIREYRFESR